MEIILNTETAEISQTAIKMLEQAGYLVIDAYDQDAASSIDGLFIRTYTKANESYLNQFSTLKYILRAGIGLDNIDMQYCKKRHIEVFNSPGANSDAVAEYILCMILVTSRKIISQMNQVTKQEWRDFANIGSGLKGSICGLLGCGHAGQSLAALLYPLGMTCIGYDPYVSKADLRAAHISKFELDVVLAQADFIAIVLPLTEETRGMLNESRLKLVKPSSILINVSRGELIDEQALILALRNKQIGGAVLDVVIGEPKVNPALMSIENLIITPHIAGFTSEANEKIATVAVNNFLTWKQSLYGG